VSFYGGFKKVKVDWANLRAALLLIHGEDDHGVPPAQGHEIENNLKRMGKEVEVVVYPGAGHAFFNDTRPEVYKADAAADAWRRTVAHLRKHVF
jgi:carboxymethylenebutenolidase